jgi:hypothetical protein
MGLTSKTDVGCADIRFALRFTDLGKRVAHHHHTPGRVVGRDMDVSEAVSVKQAGASTIGVDNWRGTRHPNPGSIPVLVALSLTKPDACVSRGARIPSSTGKVRLPRCLSGRITARTGKVAGLAAKPPFSV